MALQNSFQPRPRWLQNLNQNQSRKEEFSKLLTTPFGMDLSHEEIDNFLYQKIIRKLTYCMSTHPSLARESNNYQSNLVFNIMVFCINIGRIHTNSEKICGLLRNFLWFGKENRTYAHVNWPDCCAKRAIRGLVIVDPEEQLTSLLVKWITYSFLQD